MRFAASGDGRHVQHSVVRGKTVKYDYLLQREEGPEANIKTIVTH